MGPVSEKGNKINQPNTSEQQARPAQIELPSGTSILENKVTGVAPDQIMSQIRETTIDFIPAK
jgi:hypothetical protein